MASLSAHLHVSASSRPGRAKVRMGYEIAPVPLDTRGKNRVLIGLGSYIVNAQLVCSDREISDGDLRAVYEYLSAIRGRTDSPKSDC